MKRLVILGSTGSIGIQALDIIRSLPERFKVVGLSAHDNSALLKKQAAEFNVKHTATTAKEIEHLAALPEADLVVNAIVGFAGLRPTLSALKAKKLVALANKESLVAGGALVMHEARKNGVSVIPIDSEHSAIFQCLVGSTPPLPPSRDTKPQSSLYAIFREGGWPKAGGVYNPTNVSRVTLTCSGGPFRGKTKKELASVTAEDALKHPTWSMGKKISIDSATLMNKGLEIIEACWLFDLKPEQVDVVIHPESIVHSFVEFVDGSVLAQLGVPKMTIPIHYALNFPERVAGPKNPSLHIEQLKQLTFEPVNTEAFESIGLAREALKVGGTMATVLNAANEVAVQLFLEKKIGFLDIPRMVKQAMTQHKAIQKPTLEEIERVDGETRVLLPSFQGGVGGGC